MKETFLNLLAFGAIISSILVITAKNPIIAVLFLISVFVNSAGYLILLGIGFVGISYIIVYVGAITVLFLFVIMLLNIRLSEIIETNTNFTKNLPLALIIGLVFIYELLTIIPFSFSDLSIITNLLNIIQSFNNYVLSFASASFFPAPNVGVQGIAVMLADETSVDITNNIVYLTNNPIKADTNFTDFLQIQSLGQNLYSFGSIWLIITALILLLAMIAPLFLTNNKTTSS